MTPPPDGDRDRPEYEGYRRREESREQWQDRLFDERFRGINDKLDAMRADFRQSRDEFRSEVRNRLEELRTHKADKLEVKNLADDVARLDKAYDRLLYGGIGSIVLAVVTAWAIGAFVDHAKVPEPVAVHQGAKE